MKLAKFFTTLGITATFALSSMRLPKPKEALAQAIKSPVVILVNGKGDCCIQEMNNVISELEKVTKDVYVVPWNSLYKSSENESDLNDSHFLKEVANYVDNQVVPSRPVILIGHSFGGNSILKVAPRITRRILFLGVLDPVALGGWRNIVTEYNVPANIDYFFNRWQTHGPLPLDIGTNGTIKKLSCSAGM